MSARFVHASAPAEVVSTCEASDSHWSAGRTRAQAVPHCCDYQKRPLGVISPKPVSGSRWYLVIKALDLADCAVTLSNLSILPCYTALVCSSLMNRSRDIQPSHDGDQCGSLQS